MLSESAAAKTELLMSAGEQLLDLVYIDDVINAFLAAGQTVFDPSESKFRSYAVTSGKPLSLREVVDVYNSVAEDRVRVVWGGRPYRDREVMIPWSGGNSIPGWEPTVSLHDGLLRCEAARQLAVQQT
jgi:nucleoside-diphosphate-sugar epimerase